MKSILVQIAFFISSFCLFGQVNQSGSFEAFTHLNEVNKEWEKNAELAPNQTISFTTDIDRIAFHLNSVGSILRDRPTSNLSVTQRNNRLALLDTLRRYAERKKFPTNSYHNKRTPYFIDEFGVHCAVGFLIQKSGHGSLALQIKQEHNYDYIRDFQTKGIDEWANSNGFTIDELAWIQPAYQAPADFTTVQNGTNGELLAMDADSLSDRIYFIGDFDSLDIALCYNVGYYENGSIQCLAGGIEGDLTDIHVYNGVVYVTGAIEFEGQSYSYATYENNSWYYHNIPGQQGKMGVTAFLNDTGLMEVVLSNGQGQTSTLWRHDGNNWSEILTTSGWIRSIAEGDNKRAYAGRMLWYSLSSNPTVLIDAKNSFLYDIIPDSIATPRGDVPFDIFKVKFINGRFFYGGQALNGEPIRKSLTTLHGDSFVAITGLNLQGDITSNWITIYDFQDCGNGKLAICGDFWIGNSTYGYGVGMANYTAFENNLNAGLVGQTGQFQILGDLPNPGKCIEVHKTNCLVGGYIPTKRNIVKYDYPLLVANSSIKEVSVYPNPMISQLNINSDQVNALHIYSLSGQEILSGQQNSIDVQSLSRGTYILKIDFENGQSQTSTIVKN